MADERFTATRQKRLLEKLQRRATFDQRQHPKRTPHFSVYVIEVSMLEAVASPVELYVGHTWHSPEERLREHADPNHPRASHIFRRGRYSPAHLRSDWMAGWPMFADKGAAERAEGEIARYLQRVGYHTHSDQKKLSKPSKA